jgi:hypothetical protein
MQKIDHLHHLWCHQIIIYIYGFHVSMAYNQGNFSKFYINIICQERKKENMATHIKSILIK